MRSVSRNPCGCQNRTRAREAELAEAARDAQREREILEELETVGRSRCEALGFDRHWNRYWLLGGWDDNKGGARGGPCFMLISISTSWPQTRCCRV